LKRAVAGSVLAVVVMLSAALAAAATLEIWQIQGSGLTSPYVNTTVTSKGNVVTAVGPAGFFMQTPEARSDNDANTSDGIYVYTGSAPTVTAGDAVDVTGTISEYHGLTEFNRPTVTGVSSGNLLPRAVELDGEHPSPIRPQPDNELERFEGMLVHVASGTVTGPTDQIGKIYLVARAGRTFREPGIAWPGLPGLPVWDGNPELLSAKLDGLGGIAPAVPAGTHINNLIGPLSQYDSSYEIWPLSFSSTGASQVRPVRARAPGEFTVATQNLEQMFDDVNDGGETVVSSEQYAARLAKHSKLIREVLGSPDVLAMQEAEKLRVLQDLAARIRQDDPGASYTGYLDPGNDPSGINVGLLVRDTVTVRSVSQIGKHDSFVYNGAEYGTFDRPPLVLEGSFVGGGGSFAVTVIAVHLRSLSGIEGSTAEFVRTKRFEGARALANAIQAMQATDPSLRLAIAGDFNAFEFSDGYVDVLGQITGKPDPAGAMLPANTAVNPPLTDQVLTLSAQERYSYVETGNAQVLDHVLTTRALTPYVSGIACGRGDADVPASLSSDTTSALRCSDHDGVVLYLNPAAVNRVRRVLRPVR